MDLTTVVGKSPKGTAIAGLSVSAFMAKTVALGGLDEANDEALATLQQKAAAGDRSAQFSVGMRIALNSRSRS